VLATGFHAAHSPLGIAWTALTAAAMFGLAAGKARVGATLGWWRADPLAGYVLVCYAAREVVTLFREAR
jgi:divalent metal cation (Fe/Co/Zn/Cd) transporter